MKTPRSFECLAIVFTVAYAIAYVIAVWQNYALFTYHPVPGTFAPGVEKPLDGPAMYWFGWMATAALAAFGACGVACVAPASLTSRLWSGWSWLAPAGVLIFFAYLLRGYFLH